MRKAAVAIYLLATTSIACKDAQQEKVSQAGVYRMEQMSYKNDRLDTTVSSPKQVKIYTGTHYIFANLSPDSIAGFGVGSYTPDGDNIIEHNIYSSSALDTAQDFKLNITRQEKGYTQNIADIKAGGETWSLTEQYSSVSNSGNSPLDGAWEQTRSLSIQGTDTTIGKGKQYKIYQNGYFLFVHRNPDPTGTKFSTGFGFGPFTLEGEKVTETNTLSNYSMSGWFNTPIPVTVVMNGSDEFTQTIIDTASKTTSIESYKRLK